MASQNFVTRPGSQFVQSGTGAVERTVEEKLQDVVSVKDFGAVGDGVTDDTAAIQSAINSVGKFGLADIAWASPNAQVNVVLPSGHRFLVTDTIWCGFLNVNLICDGDIIASDSWSSGKPVIDFDYAQMHAPAYIFSHPYNQENPPRGNYSGWDLRHVISVGKATATWTNSDETIKYDTAKLTFAGNPTSGDTIRVNGVNIVFGTDVTIGASASDTIDNLIAWLATNLSWVRTTKESASLLTLQGAFPASTMIISGTQITLTQWQIGSIGVRMTNAWNSSFTFKKLLNFDVGLWIEPWNNLGGVEAGKITEFGSENNTIDFGRVYNCQITCLVRGGYHEGAPYVGSSTLGINKVNTGYINDTRIINGSIRDTQRTKNSYGFVFDSTEIYNFTSDYLDTEGGRGRDPNPREKCFLLISSLANSVRLWARNEWYTTITRAEIGNPKLWPSGAGPFYPNQFFEPNSAVLQGHAAYEALNDTLGPMPIVDNTGTKNNYINFSKDRWRSNQQFADQYSVDFFAATSLRDRVINVGNNTYAPLFWWFKNNEGYVKYTTSTTPQESAGSLRIGSTEGPGVELLGLSGSESFVMSYKIRGAFDPSDTLTTGNILIRLFDSSNNEITRNGSVSGTYDATIRAFKITRGVEASQRIVLANSQISKLFIWFESAEAFPLFLESFRLSSLWTDQPPAVNTNLPAPISGYLAPGNVTIPANSLVSYDVTSTGVKADGTYFTTASITPASASVLVSSQVVSDNQVKVSLFNPTASPVTLTSLAIRTMSSFRLDTFIHRHALLATN